MSTSYDSHLYSEKEYFFDQADRITESIYNQVQHILRKTGYFHLFCVCLLTLVGCCFIKAYITQSHPVILSALLASIFFILFSYLLGGYLIKMKKLSHLDELAYQLITKLKHLHTKYPTDQQHILSLSKALCFFSAYVEKKQNWKTETYTFSPSELCKADYIYFQEKAFSLLIEHLEQNGSETLFDPLFHHHLALSHFSFAMQYSRLSLWTFLPWYQNLISDDNTKKKKYINKALTEWNLALHLNPDDHEPLFHCYQCYVQLNNSAKQCEILEQLYQLKKTR